LEGGKNGNDITVFFRVGFGACEEIKGADIAVEGAEETEELEFCHG
jgi:hypothetical protein